MRVFACALHGRKSQFVSHHLTLRGKQDFVNVILRGSVRASLRLNVCVCVAPLSRLCVFFFFFLQPQQRAGQITSGGDLRSPAAAGFWWRFWDPLIPWRPPVRRYQGAGRKKDRPFMEEPRPRLVGRIISFQYSDRENLVTDGIDVFVFFFSNLLGDRAIERSATVRYRM